VSGPGKSGSALTSNHLRDLIHRSETALLKGVQCHHLLLATWALEQPPSGQTAKKLTQCIKSSLLLK
ncbi:hypothetical protein, partial [Alcanivorax sp. HI0033]|uniref:hypothetical protein n=1 Tax=Alcanivorax sp. HI0033 TaxID=1822228 RepID=UPI001E4F1F31